MSEQAMVPCFCCGKQLDNAFRESDNQPSDGTEFTTYGHYGEIELEQIGNYAGRVEWANGKYLDEARQVIQKLIEIETED